MSCKRVSVNGVSMEFRPWRAVGILFFFLLLQFVGVEARAQYTFEISELGLKQSFGAGESPRVEVDVCYDNFKTFPYQFYVSLEGSKVFSQFSGSGPSGVTIQSLSPNQKKASVPIFFSNTFAKGEADITLNFTESGSSNPIVIKLHLRPFESGNIKWEEVLSFDPSLNGDTLCLNKQAPLVQYTLSSTSPVFNEYKGKIELVLPGNHNAVLDKDHKTVAIPDSYLQGGNGKVEITAKYTFGACTSKTPVKRSYVVRTPVEQVDALKVTKTSGEDAQQLCIEPDANAPIKIVGKFNQKAHVPVELDIAGANKGKWIVEAETDGQVVKPASIPVQFEWPKDSKIAASKKATLTFGDISPTCCWVNIYHQIKPLEVELFPKLNISYDGVADEICLAKGEEYAIQLKGDWKYAQKIEWSLATASNVLELIPASDGGSAKLQVKNGWSFNPSKPVEESITIQVKVTTPGNGVCGGARPGNKTVKVRVRPRNIDLVWARPKCVADKSLSNVPVRFSDAVLHLLPSVKGVTLHRATGSGLDATALTELPYGKGNYGLKYANGSCITNSTVKEVVALPQFVDGDIVKDGAQKHCFKEGVKLSFSFASATATDEKLGYWADYFTGVQVTREGTPAFAEAISKSKPVVYALTAEDNAAKTLRFNYEVLMTGTIDGTCSSLSAAEYTVVPVPSSVQANADCSGKVTLVFAPSNPPSGASVTVSYPDASFSTVQETGGEYSTSIENHVAIVGKLKVDVGGECPTSALEAYLDYKPLPESIVFDTKVEYLCLSNMSFEGGAMKESLTIGFKHKTSKPNPANYVVKYEISLMDGTEWIREREAIPYGAENGKLKADVEIKAADLATCPVPEGGEVMLAIKVKVEVVGNSACVLDRTGRPMYRSVVRPAVKFAHGSTLQYCEGYDFSKNKELRVDSPKPEPSALNKGKEQLQYSFDRKNWAELGTVIPSSADGKIERPMWVRSHYVVSGCPVVSDPVELTVRNKPSLKIGTYESKLCGVENAVVPVVVTNRPANPSAIEEWTFKPAGNPQPRVEPGTSANSVNIVDVSENVTVAYQLKDTKGCESTQAITVERFPIISLERKGADSHTICLAKTQRVGTQEDDFAQIAVTLKPAPSKAMEIQWELGGLSKKATVAPHTSELHKPADVILPTAAGDYELKAKLYYVDKPDCFQELTWQIHIVEGLATPEISAERLVGTNLHLCPSGEHTTATLKVDAPAVGVTLDWEDAGKALAKEQGKAEITVDKKGTFTAIYSNATCKSVSKPVTVAIAPVFDIALSGDVLKPSCPGEKDAEFQFDIKPFSGGEYTYSIEGAVPPVENVKTNVARVAIKGQEAYVGNLSVKDQYGCTATTNPLKVDLTVPSFILKTNVIAATCPDKNDSKIQLDIEGGNSGKHGFSVYFTEKGSTTKSTAVTINDRHYEISSTPTYTFKSNTTYVVSVRDKSRINGAACPNGADAEVKVPEAAPRPTGEIQVIAACEGASNGQLWIAANTTKEGKLSCSLDSKAAVDIVEKGKYQLISSALQKGHYKLVVRDADDCASDPLSGDVTEQAGKLDVKAYSPIWHGQSNGGLIATGEKDGAFIFSPSALSPAPKFDDGKWNATADASSPLYSKAIFAEGAEVYYYYKYRRTIPGELTNIPEGEQFCLSAEGKEAIPGATSITVTPTEANLTKEEPANCSASGKITLKPTAFSAIKNDRLFEKVIFELLTTPPQANPSDIPTVEFTDKKLEEIVKGVTFNAVPAGVYKLRIRYQYKNEPAIPVGKERYAKQPQKDDVQPASLFVTQEVGTEIKLDNPNIVSFSDVSDLSAPCPGMEGEKGSRRIELTVSPKNKDIVCEVTPNQGTQHYDMASGRLRIEGLADTEEYEVRVYRKGSDRELCSMVQKFAPPMGGRQPIALEPQVNIYGGCKEGAEVLLKRATGWSGNFEFAVAPFDGSIATPPATLTYTAGNTPIAYAHSGKIMLWVRDVTKTECFKKVVALRPIPAIVKPELALTPPAVLNLVCGQTAIRVPYAIKPQNEAYQLLVTKDGKAEFAVDKEASGDKYVDLVAGTYTVSASIRGCASDSSDPVTISSASKILLKDVVAVPNTSCSLTAAEGSVSLNVENGDNAKWVLHQVKGSPAEPDRTGTVAGGKLAIEKLPSGQYTLTVGEACPVETPVVIGGKPVLSLEVTDIVYGLGTANPSSFRAVLKANGVEVNSGVTYRLGNGTENSSGVFTGLTEPSYTVRAELDGCHSEEQVVRFVELNGPTISWNYNASTGSIRVSVVQPAGDYVITLYKGTSAIDTPREVSQGTPVEFAGLGEGQDYKITVANKTVGTGKILLKIPVTLSRVLPVLLSAEAVQPFCTAKPGSVVVRSEDASIESVQLFGAGALFGTPVIKPTPTGKNYDYAFSVPSAQIPCSFTEAQVVFTDGAGQQQTLLIPLPSKVDLMQYKQPALELNYTDNCSAGVATELTFNDLFINGLPSTTTRADVTCTPNAISPAKSEFTMSLVPGTTKWHTDCEVKLKSEENKLSLTFSDARQKNLCIEAYQVHPAVCEKTYHVCSDTDVIDIPTSHFPNIVKPTLRMKDGTKVAAKELEHGSTGFKGIPCGEYTLEGTGAMGTKTLTVTVAVYPGSPLELTRTGYVPTCGVANLTYTVSGGQEITGQGYKFSFAKENGIIAAWTPKSIQLDPATLQPGSQQNFTVVDARGCSVSETLVVPYKPFTVSKPEHVIGTPECPANSLANSLGEVGNTDPELLEAKYTIQFSGEDYDPKKFSFTIEKQDKGSTNWTQVGSQQNPDGTSLKGSFGVLPPAKRGDVSYRIKASGLTTGGAQCVLDPIPFEVEPNPLANYQYEVDVDKKIASKGKKWCDADFGYIVPGKLKGGAPKVTYTYSWSYLNEHGAWVVDSEETDENLSLAKPNKWKLRAEGGGCVFEAPPFKVDGVEEIKVRKMQIVSMRPCVEMDANGKYKDVAQLSFDVEGGMEPYSFIFSQNDEWPKDSEGNSLAGENFVAGQAVGVKFANPIPQYLLIKDKVGCTSRTASKWLDNQDLLPKPPPVIDIPDVTTICHGGVAMVGPVDIAGNDLNFYLLQNKKLVHEWVEGKPGPVARPNQDGYFRNIKGSTTPYELMVIDPRGCETIVSVNVLDAPEIQLTNSSFVPETLSACPGERFDRINIKFGDEDIREYKWTYINPNWEASVSKGKDALYSDEFVTYEPSLEYALPGKYRIEGKTTKGCSFSAQLVTKGASPTYVAYETTPAECRSGKKVRYDAHGKPLIDPSSGEYSFDYTRGKLEVKEVVPSAGITFSLDGAPLALNAPHDVLPGQHAITIQSATCAEVRNFNVGIDPKKNVLMQVGQVKWPKDRKFTTEFNLTEDSFYPNAVPICYGDSALVAIKSITDGEGKPTAQPDVFAWNFSYTVPRTFISQNQTVARHDLVQKGLGVSRYPETKDAHGQDVIKWEYTSRQRVIKSALPVIDRVTAVVSAISPAGCLARDSLSIVARQRLGYLLNPYSSHVGILYNGAAPDKRNSVGLKGIENYRVHDSIAIGVLANVPNRIEFDRTVSSAQIVGFKPESLFSHGEGQSDWQRILTVPDGADKGQGLGEGVKLVKYTPQDNSGKEYTFIRAIMIAESLSDSEGMQCQEEIPIYIRLVNTLRIPNVFTPNGDGINDRWLNNGDPNYDNLYSHLKDLLPNIEVDVFTRGGARVWHAKGEKIAEGWDGRSSTPDAPLPVGTYYYVIRFNVPDAGQSWKPISGSVTIVR